MIYHDDIVWQKQVYKYYIDNCTKESSLTLRIEWSFLKENDYSLFTGCRYPSHWEFCSRVPLTLSSPPRMTSYEAWPHLKLRRERVERRPVVAALIDQRWFQGWPQCDSGTRPAERPSQFMGRELSLATCYPICNWVTLLWVPSYLVMNLEQEDMT